MENHTILLVDDEPTNLKLMERAIKNSFKTITVSSGEEALEVLQREDVSILITDQRMPGLSGTELLRKARSMDANMICLLVTASNDMPTYIDAMINSGAIGVIHKPWNAVKFKETIQEAIKKYESRLKTNQSINKLKRAINAFDKIANSKDPAI
jgi:DNA-binding NtrC family response regulator